MIGLALVPTAAIVAISLLEGNYPLAGKAFLRFALDVGLVFIFSFLDFLWVKRFHHRRNTRM